MFTNLKKYNININAIIIAQYVNCAAANPGADAGMYDASEQYKLSTLPFMTHLKS